MTYKVKKTWKDLADNKPKHRSLTRRDLLLRGMATGAMSVLLPKAFFGDWVKTAMAAPGNCPPPNRVPGAIAQIFSEGGPTMGARFIGEAQMNAMNATMAANYGITGTNLVKLGSNLVIDSTSPFGFTLLQGPPGYPGGAAAWRANVLSKISGGGHLGPFNADDGAGQNSGLIGAVSPFKVSQMGKDLVVNGSVTPASWANGAPKAVVKGRPTTDALAKTFTLTPAATGLTNTAALTAASDGANAIAQALDPVFNTSKRKFASQLITNAGCAFYGNSVMADPNYGNSLFNPANITALTQNVTVGTLSAQEQAQLAAFYQSAVGVAGGVIQQFNGRDYHGADPGNNIAPADIEEARSIVMFLAACDVAQAPGAMIYLSNGQAIADGTQQVNATINGNNVTINAPVAKSDAGGAYNAGLIIFYDPKGSPPMARMTGTIDNNGNAKTDASVGSSSDAVGGLFLSAHKWINGGSIPQAALGKVQSAGAASNPSNVVVI